MGETSTDTSDTNEGGAATTPQRTELTCDEYSDYSTNTN